MFIDVQEEFCATKNGGQKSLFINILLKNVENYSNINQPCPWHPGDYFIKDFNFGIEHIPSIMPEGRYNMKITILVGEANRFVANWNVYCRITNYGILDLNIG